MHLFVMGNIMLHNSSYFNEGLAEGWVIKCVNMIDGR